MNERIYDIYTDHYFRSRNEGYDNYELTADLRVKTFERWYGEIEPHLRGTDGPALDIGCAAGYFLDVLKERGWDAEGIELDPDMEKVVREKGYPVSNQPLEHFDRGRKYSLITLFDVIEHLPDLQRDVRKLGTLLEDDGTIALVTPDFTSLQRKVFGRRWFQFKPTEHIHYFSPETLQRLVSSCGLTLTCVSRSGQYADVSFLHNRLMRYGFSRFASLFAGIIRTFGLSKAMWYADTGSMLAIIQKKR
jgi:SAM-dependent methyltransferase